MSNAKMYSELTVTQQEQAQARFLDAGPQDGYRYEVSADGNIFFRTQQTAQEKLRPSYVFGVFRSRGSTWR